MGDAQSNSVEFSERDRNLTRSLRSRTPLLGTVVSSSDPVLAERLARVFDLLWIDLEHSALGLRDVQMLTIAAQAGGAFAVVRLPRANSELLTAVLDMGVDGLVAPKVSSAIEAELFASSLRYPPAGHRGYAPRRAHQRSSNGRPTSDVACIVQIESRRALDNLNVIVSTDGVHAVVVGANDLSLELEIGLDLEAAELIDAAARVGAAANDHDVAWGLAVSGLPDWVRNAPERGASLTVFASDARLYFDGVAAAVDRLEQFARPTTPLR
jgi:2-keto-3-deoxy-L-rhamnonate aldolase RhmA